MPWELRRYQSFGDLHFITFSCYRRKPKLGDAGAREQFEVSLEQTRVKYGLRVYGYMVMPEHVHLLLSEPTLRDLAHAIQSVKQSVARKLTLRAAESFWQERYYDFNVVSQRKFCEKLKCLHGNPVARGLVKKPEDWEWSSLPHYLTGEPGRVEVESHWTQEARWVAVATVGLR